MFEVGVLEVEGGAHVTARRQRDDTRAVGTSQRGEQTREQSEVADVVHRKLRLEPARIAR
jgi:hypothetical protein